MSNTKPYRRRVFKNLYLKNRFFYVLGGLCVFFILCFWVEDLLPIAYLFSAILLGLVLVEIVDLFRIITPLAIERKLDQKVLSLNDPNPIYLKIQSHSKGRTRKVRLYEVLPVELQLRDFFLTTEILPGQIQELEYMIQPKQRGLYSFGSTIAYLSSTFPGLMERRFEVPHSDSIPVYPSIQQMKKYSLFSNLSVQNMEGIKKIRRIGHGYEFEQIKQYVPGDDVRSINWKATSRTSELMVNHYEDEKSQSVYLLLDKSRNMDMPFEGMRLLDYSINASLIIANTVLQKKDKIGLISFSDRIGSSLKADNKNLQLHKILESLYREKYRNTASNFELLYQISQKLINRRSLLFLFTNFESELALQRALPILRRINYRHLLVVILFENTEISSLSDKQAKTIEDIYQKTIASQFINEKQKMVYILKSHGIQTIFCPPKDLNISTLNKYLELKAKGLI